MRVLLVYPGVVFATYDIARGYEDAFRDLDVDFDVFRHHQFIQFYEESLRHWEEKNPRYKYNVEDVIYQASIHIASKIIDMKPDIALFVGGGEIHLRAYQLVHNASVKIAVILTESPYEDEIQEKIIEQCEADLVFTNERTSTGTLNAVYLPLAYNPRIHKPTPASDDHISTVFFHGTMWEDRRAYIEPLGRIAGARISGADGGKVISNNEMAKFYQSCLIAVNHHRHSDQAESLNPRAYEIAACGAFQLCDHRTELDEVFGNSVPTYSTPDELYDLAVYYIAHDYERERLAKMAYERVAPHTYKQRAIETLLPALEKEVLR